jgi:hypothetical protein
MSELIPPSPHESGVELLSVVLVVEAFEGIALREAL